MVYVPIKIETFGDLPEKDGSSKFSIDVFAIKGAEKVHGYFDLTNGDFLEQPSDRKVEVTHWLKPIPAEEYAKASQQNISEFANELFQEIKHGDQEHQDWLENKINDFVNRKTLNI